MINVSELSVEETAMRIIRLVAERARRARGGDVVSRPNAKYGPAAWGVRRDMAEKGWVPARYWVRLVDGARRSRWCSSTSS